MALWCGSRRWAAIVCWKIRLTQISRRRVFESTRLRVAEESCTPPHKTLDGSCTSRPWRTAMGL